MNKKKLSVVMAGAMLASSVAPVLAATTVEKEEVSASNLGLLISEIRDLLKSKTYSDTSKDAVDVNGVLAGKSIYDIKIKGVSQNLDTDSTQQQFQTVLANLKPGTVVEIWEKGYEEVDGKILSQKKAVPTYDKDELADLETELGTTLKNGNLKKVINKAELSSDQKTLTVTFESKVAAGASLEIKLGDEEFDTRYYLTPTNVKNEISSGEVVAADFAGFPKKEAVYGPIASGEKIKEYTITSGGNNLTVEDLYDGLMLTTKGHDFFEEIKEAKISRGITNATKPTVVGNKGGAITTSQSAIDEIVKDANGKYSFTVTVGTGKQNGLDPVTYTIVGEDEKNTERLALWIYDELAKVDILAGANRYATAVEIAESYTGLSSVSNGTEISDNLVANIVLVNGEALVDGLAASPLAASLSDSDHKAPILLTEADRLPKETKAYLRRALAQVNIGDVKKVTIHLVGGEAVLSNSLVRELRDMGFSVERYGGANREETSLEVADALGAKANNRVFVVGANGEADAMSISAVASTADGNSKFSPIVVAKNGGISEDALYELRGKDAVVIGGEKSVSDDEITALRDEAKSVIRVSGANRQATNAAIIEKYYANHFADSTVKAENVVVAKDGQNNKMDLVDALAAANFAAQNKAPIVLATNKLSDAQINMLELNAQNAKALYQVGHGVDKDNVVKVIAQRLGLAN